MVMIYYSPPLDCGESGAVKFVSFIFAFGLLVQPFAPAIAQTTPGRDEDGGRKMNLSGRQRMLLQRMAKSACFTALGVDTDGHVRELLQAHADFDRTLKGLRDGSQADGLFPETDPAVVKKLDAVASLWSLYSPIIQSVAGHLEGHALQAALKRIYELNLGLLLEMNDAVSLLENKYGTPGNTQAKLSSIINVAGRQRMLSQKMSKEFCMAASGYEAAGNRALMLGTIALFESSQDWLKRESALLEMTPAKADELHARQEKIDGLWTSLRAFLSQAAAGKEPDRGEIAAVASTCRILLAELNNAVRLYESVYASASDQKGRTD